MLITCLNILYIFTSVVISQILPGIGPTNFCLDEEHSNCQKTLVINVNSLYSSYELTSMQYSDSRFCVSNKTNVNSMNFGQMIFGDHLEPSDYEIEFIKPKTCSKACQNIHSKDDLRKIHKSIEKRFKHEWIADNLPVLFCANEDEKAICATHFYPGCLSHSLSAPEEGIECTLQKIVPKDSIVIYNHMHFEVVYHRIHRENSPLAQLVSIRVIPESRVDCVSSPSPVYFSLDTEELNVTYTYSVTFKEAVNYTMNSRYDYIYNNPEYGSIRWASIAVSLLLVLILTGVGALFFIRAIRRDILRYTELLKSAYDTQEDYGWKLLKGDIFRAPKYPLILSATVGSGLQIVFMALVTLFCAHIGFFTPSSRGSLITCVIVLYFLLGALSGYVSARIYRFFDGEYWKSCLLATALLHPGIIFFCVFIINMALNIAEIHSAITFTTLLSLFAFWTILSVPLTFAGAFIGFKRRPIKSPVKKNMIPRSIPRQRLLIRPFMSIIIGGLICFICIYMQLHFIMRSIWLHNSYVMFGLLFGVVILLTILCAEVSVIFCYLHLCSEDYRWQWRSFFTVAFTSFYCLMYIIKYYTNLNISSSMGAFVYFSYSIIMLYMLFLATGAIGFVTCFYILLKIFSSIKVD